MTFRRWCASWKACCRRTNFPLNTLGGWAQACPPSFYPMHTYTFDEATHICRDENGALIPSATQILRVQGLSPDLHQFVTEERLDRKSKIGRDVHWLSDVYDEHADIDRSWLTAETAGYFESWVAFRRISGFAPRRWSTRLYPTLNGFRYTMEFDKEGVLGRCPAILDLKTGAGKPAYWGYQLGAYEMGLTELPRLGRYVRAVCQLYEDGQPGRLIYYENHQDDAQQFLAALCNCTKRIELGTLKVADLMT